MNENVPQGKHIQGGKAEDVIQSLVAHSILYINEETSHETQVVAVR